MNTAGEVCFTACMKIDVTGDATGSETDQRPHVLMRHRLCPLVLLVPLDETQI